MAERRQQMVVDREGRPVRAVISACHKRRSCRCTKRNQS